MSRGVAAPLPGLPRPAGGFCFGATEAADAESPRRRGTVLSARLAPPSPFHFANWAEAVLNPGTPLSRRAPGVDAIFERLTRHLGNNDRPGRQAGTARLGNGPGRTGGPARGHGPGREQRPALAALRQ